MKNFVIKLRVTPLVLTTSSPLDAILGGIIIQRYKDVRAATEVTMVERLDGIPMASVAVFPNGYTMGRAYKMRNLGAIMQTERARAVVDGELAASAIHKHGLFSGDDTRPSHLKLLQNSRNLIIPNDGEINYDIHYHVRGDINEITRLLKLAGCIGSWRDGHGDITSMAVTETEGHDTFGILDGDDLIRPVPISFDRGSKKRHLNGRYSNPYSPKVARQHGYEFHDLFVPHNPATMIPY